MISTRLTNEQFKKVVRSFKDIQKGVIYLDPPEEEGDSDKPLLINEEDRRIRNFSVDSIIHAPGRKMIVEILDSRFRETGTVIVFYNRVVRRFRPTTDEIDIIRKAPNLRHEDTLHTNFRWDEDNQIGAQLMTEYMLPYGHALCYFRLPDTGEDEFNNINNPRGDLSDDEQDDLNETPFDWWWYFWHPVILNVEADRIGNDASVVFPYDPDVPRLQPFKTPRIYSYKNTHLDAILFPDSASVQTLPERLRHESGKNVNTQISISTPWIEKIAAACVAPGPVFWFVYLDMRMESVDPLTFFSTIALWQSMKKRSMWEWPFWKFVVVREGQIVIENGYVYFRNRNNLLMKSVQLSVESSPNVGQGKRLRTNKIYP